MWPPWRCVLIRTGGAAAGASFGSPGSRGVVGSSFRYVTVTGTSFSTSSVGPRNVDRLPPLP
jgi:hypothetical protein